jgi:hypothetical protein
MLNIKHFIDTNGHRAEIDQRNVCEAYVDSTSDSRSIVIVQEGTAAIHLGIGALDEVETWLGFKDYGGLPSVTVRRGVLSGHKVGFKNVSNAKKILRRPRVKARIEELRRQKAEWESPIQIQSLTRARARGATPK